MTVHLVQTLCRHGVVDKLLALQTRSRRFHFRHHQSVGQVFKALSHLHMTLAVSGTLNSNTTIMLVFFYFSQQKNEFRRENVMDLIKQLCSRQLSISTNCNTTSEDIINRPRDETRPYLIQTSLIYTYFIS